MFFLFYSPFPKHFFFQSRFCRSERARDMHVMIVLRFNCSFGTRSLNLKLKLQPCYRRSTQLDMPTSHASHLNPNEHHSLGRLR